MSSLSSSPANLYVLIILDSRGVASEQSGPWTWLSQTEVGKLLRRERNRVGQAENVGIRRLYDDDLQPVNI